MTFEDLKDAVCGETVLVSEMNIERYFLVISNDKLITQMVKDGSLAIWREEEIKNWKIKPLEEKSITITESDFDHYCELARSEHPHGKLSERIMKPIFGF